MRKDRERGVSTRRERSERWYWREECSEPPRKDREKGVSTLKERSECWYWRKEFSKPLRKYREREVSTRRERSEHWYWREERVRCEEIEILWFLREFHITHFLLIKIPY